MVNAAALLIKRGHSVYLGCKPGSQLMQRAEQRGIPVRPFRIRGDIDPLMTCKIDRFLRKEQVDILICNFIKDIRVAGLAGRFAGTRLILARQGLVLCRNKLKYELSFRYLTDGLIVNSGSVRDTYISYGWFDDHQISVVYNGVSVETQTPPIDIGSAFPMTTDRMVILSAGRFDPQKGLMSIVEMAKIAKEMGKAWAFLIAGDGPLRPLIQSQITENDLSDYVALVGFQPNLRGLMKSGDVFVLPSRFEGMPNVVMEAMAEGMPVVASDVDGIRELMNDGETGYLVSSDAPHEFVDRLIRLEDGDRRRKMGASGRERVLQLFTWERMADQLESCFRRRLGDS